jgi:nicotinate-nucleotide adenylyltransferase
VATVLGVTGGFNTIHRSDVPAILYDLRHPSADRRAIYRPGRYFFGPFLPATARRGTRIGPGLRRGGRAVVVGCPLVGERVGIFGGTFDPPHVGHVIVAVNACHDLGLDRVLVIPAGVPWQKVEVRAISAAADRLARVHAAFGGIDRLEVSTVELDRHGESYTVETLEGLIAADPTVQLHLLVGSDLAPALDTWKRPDALRSLATIVVYDRPGWQGGTVPTGWPSQSVAVPQVDVSSTDIRARVGAGRPIDGMVAREVAAIIHQRALYSATAGAAKR